MMTATQTETGDFMGRTGEDLFAASLPADYSIRAEYGQLLLRCKNVLLVAVLDPAVHESADERTSGRTSRRITGQHLVRAADHHRQARRLLSAEMDEHRFGLSANAEATTRRRLDRRDDYYDAIEDAVGCRHLDNHSAVAAAEDVR